MYAFVMWQMKRGSSLEESRAAKIKLRAQHSNNHKEDTVLNHVECR